MARTRPLFPVWDAETMARAGYGPPPSVYNYQYAYLEEPPLRPLPKREPERGYDMPRHGDEDGDDR
jgi:hypothetical protein